MTAASATRSPSLRLRRKKFSSRKSFGASLFAPKAGLDLAKAKSNDFLVLVDGEKVKLTLWQWPAVSKRGCWPAEVVTWRFILPRHS